MRYMLLVTLLLISFSLGAGTSVKAGCRVIKNGKAIMNVCYGR